MQTRRSLLALLLSLAATTPSRAALPPDIVAQVERYLNGIETLRARFTQIDPDNRISLGQVFIHRPGRMRFEYEPPAELLLVATDWRLVMYDTRTEQTTTIPVSRTPLGLLLDDPIRLRGPVTIRGIAEINSELVMTLFQTDEPGLGELELVFGLSPIELRRWTVLDAQGKTTQVLLEDVETNIDLEPQLFRPPRSVGRG